MKTGAHSILSRGTYILDAQPSIDRAIVLSRILAPRLRNRITIASRDGDVWRLQSNTFQEFNDCSVSVSVNLRRLFSSFDHGE